MLQKVYIIGQLTLELKLRSANSDLDISDRSSESSEFVRKTEQFVCSYSVVWKENSEEFVSGTALAAGVSLPDSSGH